MRRWLWRMPYVSDLDEAERQALNAAIARAWESAKAGKGRRADAIVDELRARRK